MECEEPTTCLVNTLVDEIGGISQAFVDSILVLERIVYLCIRHGTGIEPHIDEVGLTVQRLSALTNQYDIIHIRTVHIDLVVVLL